MGTETRIGIATGLVIVVVASVYFFYGSERPDDQLLVATGSKAIQSPKIPQAEPTVSKPAAQRPQSLTSGTPISKNNRPAAGRPQRAFGPNKNKPSPAPAVVTLPQANRTASIQQPSTGTTGNGSSLGSLPIQSVAPTGQPSITPSTVSDSSSAAPISTALRGNSSQMLIEATKKNNANGSDQTPALALTGRSDGDVIDPDGFSMDRPGLNDRLLADATHPKSNIGLSPTVNAPPSSTTAAPSPSTNDLHVIGEAIRRQKTTPTNTTASPAPVHLSSTEPASAKTSPLLLETIKPAVESWPKKHTVQTGDTLVAISETHYGTILHADDILKANPQIKSAKALKIGDVVSLPSPDAFTAVNKANAVTPTDVATVGALKPDARTTETTKTSLSPTSYTVQLGDTFSSIAGKKLGDKNRWKELYDLNRKVVKGNAKALRPGMTLALPK